MAWLGGKLVGTRLTGDSKRAAYWLNRAKSKLTALLSINGGSDFYNSFVPEEGILCRIGQHLGKPFIKIHAAPVIGYLLTQPTNDDYPDGWGAPLRNEAGVAINPPQGTPGSARPGVAIEKLDVIRRALAPADYGNRAKRFKFNRNLIIEASIKWPTNYLFHKDANILTGDLRGGGILDGTIWINNIKFSAPNYMELHDFTITEQNINNEYRYFLCIIGTSNGTAPRVYFAEINARALAEPRLLTPKDIDTYRTLDWIAADGEVQNLFSVLDGPAVPTGAVLDAQNFGSTPLNLNNFLLCGHPWVISPDAEEAQCVMVLKRVHDLSMWLATQPTTPATYYGYGATPLLPGIAQRYIATCAISWDYTGGTPSITPEMTRLDGVAVNTSRTLDRVITTSGREVLDSGNSGPYYVQAWRDVSEHETGQLTEYEVALPALKYYHPLTASSESLSYRGNWKALMSQHVLQYRYGYGMAWPDGGYPVYTDNPQWLVFGIPPALQAVVDSVTAVLAGRRFEEVVISTTDRSGSGISWVNSFSGEALSIYLSSDVGGVGQTISSIMSNGDTSLTYSSDRSGVTENRGYLFDFNPVAGADAFISDVYNVELDTHETMFRVKLAWQVVGGVSYDIDTSLDYNTTKQGLQQTILGQSYRCFSRRHYASSYWIPGITPEGVVPPAHRTFNAYKFVVTDLTPAGVGDDAGVVVWGDTSIGLSGITSTPGPNAKYYPFTTINVVR